MFLSIQLALITRGKTWASSLSYTCFTAIEIRTVPQQPISVNPFVDVCLIVRRGANILLFPNDTTNYTRSHAVVG